MGQGGEELVLGPVGGVGRRVQRALALEQTRQLRVRLVGLPAGVGPLPDGPDRGRQAHEVLGRLDDVIVEADLHRLHRELLAAGRREHDHRRVRIAILDPTQHLQPIRPAKLVVGDDDVEAPALEGAVEFRRIGDLDDLRRLHGALQREARQRPIVRIVVEEQQAKPAHGAVSTMTGPSLVAIQYSPSVRTRPSRLSKATGLTR